MTDLIEHSNWKRLSIAWLLGAAVLVVLGSVLQAQPSAHYDELARRARSESERIEKEAKRPLRGVSKTTPDDMRKAAETMVAANHAHAAAQLKLAEAYESGAKAKIESALAESQKANDQILRSRELWNTRQLMQGSFSTPPIIAGMTREAREFKLMPELKSYLAADQAVIATGDKLTAALYARAPQETLEAARDEWIAAIMERHAADRAWTNARTLVVRLQEAQAAKNAAAVARVEEARKTEAEMLLLMRQDNVLQLKLRKLQKQRDNVAASLTLPKSP